MYIKLPNIYPYSISKLRSDNPNVSFPSEIPDERLADWGVYRVTKTSPPTCPSGSIVEESKPAQINGEWTQQWIIRAASADETSQQEADVREQRNQMLSDCDWTQVADAPVDKNTWAVYRQALRDITSQTGFPWDVIWPSKPI